MYQANLAVESIGSSLRSALGTGFIREEDTLVIFHDLSFLKERIQYLTSLFPPQTLHAGYWNFPDLLAQGLKLLQPGS
jgi:hypothetical protein